MFKGGLGDLLQNAGKIREEFKKMQETMASKTVEASVGGGMVKVIANGKYQVMDIKLDPACLKMNDVEMLQDLIKAGVNEALRGSQNLIQEEMSRVAGPLGPMLKGMF